ncbi:GTPase ERA [Seminavis robusta]|uniref:GTPase ERA n=1 Tax=Seminavis robusta TaxID=568900 RepID=A0A9N8E542_9STRA|nr:GTPase ERA [Seminavis robusta]|eukprot:Sro680_g186170.1 GTPase ERA (405) ;mRNA; r:1252-2573
MVTSTSSDSEDTSSSNDGSQRELLETLDSAFDYEGRVDPRLTNHDFRSGYVSVIGAPNMGKSTLVNALLEEPLCIATRRPQTTRHAILGILTTTNCQLCLLDTPGVIGEPAYKLQEGMMEAVQGALQSADVLLVVTDLFSTPIPNDDLFQKIQTQANFRPVIVVINKIDLIHKISSSTTKNTDQPKDDETTKTVTVEQAVARWRQMIPQAIAIIPTCASSDDNSNQKKEDPGVTALRKILVGGPDLPAAIRNLGRPIPGMFPADDTVTMSDEQAQQLLPLGPPLYDKDMYTDRTERFLASEMIRAALLETFQKELPYCCEVQVTAFKEQQTKLIKIDANIFVERDSQKRIVIGTQGAKIKQVGMLARETLQDFFQTKIYLQLQVKVDKDWRKQDDKLKRFGYIQ